MVEFSQQGTTVTSVVYCETHKRTSMVVQNKRRGMLTSRVLVVLLHGCSHWITAGPFQLGVVCRPPTLQP
jgi:hypothetical protein